MSAAASTPYNETREPVVMLGVHLFHCRSCGTATEHQVRLQPVRRDDPTLTGPYAVIECLAHVDGDASTFLYCAPTRTGERS